ncbi:MAG: elongation factor G [Bacteroidales bacterium]|jgi:elongation factor G|nr:elongation factor G [Bacteroidales bacterium]MDI9576115.1 elongation factor G [Bacteroidota bacterium]MDD3755782.1 elongation factor G [Bacteroidales bacterium]MDY0400495.1 elongation factor G [Bacteroidales bacterium]HHW59426.1 elongation factor G [Bacteroidales bacterium]
MKAYQVKDIRNVAIIGSPKSGKTTFVEAMLFDANVINRRGNVDEGNTVSDYRDIEIERGYSVYSSVLALEYENSKINVIDTPGFDDFIGEILAALKVCDINLNLINAANGIEVGTEILWRHLDRLNKSAIFVFNQLEHEKAQFQEIVNDLNNSFSNRIIPFQYPLNVGPDFKEVVDVLSEKLIIFTDSNGNYTEKDLPDSEKSKVADLKNQIIELVAESDEKLMEKYFENGTLDYQDIQNNLKKAIISKSIFPVFCASAKLNYGVKNIMNFLVHFAPAPNELPFEKAKSGRELSYNPNDPFVGFVFKTTIEQHLGELSFIKIYSGTLSEGMDVVNATNGQRERISQLLVINGKNREKISQVYAGDIVATVKLRYTSTNDTLTSAKNTNDIVEPIEYPEPKYRVAIRAKNTADDEKLGAVLQELHRTDPTLQVEYSKELKQIILSAQGEMHALAAKWQIETIEKIPIEFLDPKIPYRETITKSARASYRHKKQSGGAGQFGEVHLMIEPYHEGMSFNVEFPIRGTEEYDLPWGGKLVFNNCIVGGAIDTRFLPAILKGIMEKMEEGPLTGSYARDIVVYVYDGKMHPVDSNEISFKIAGRSAFREAFKNAGPRILEPIYEIEVLVPADRMGDVMTDLQNRRGIILGMEAEGNYQKIKAKVPLAELNRYSTALSSLTSGKATFTMKFSEYQQVPSNIQETLLKAYEEKDEE